MIKMGDPFLPLAKIKNAFPRTLDRKGVLCVTKTVKLKVKLGVFWLASYIPFTYPHNLFKISEI